MEKSYKIRFLEKSILNRETDLNDTDTIILKCINLAYRDMLTAGKYYLVNDEVNNMESRCNRLKLILEERNYIYSRDIIEKACILFGTEEKIGLDNKYATRYGLAQKFVNMTYKYFYVFNDYIKKEIDFSNCDCPLDSVILRKNQELKGYTWSKLTKEDYEFCQKIISERLPKESLNDELKLLGNLAFDFRYW